MPDFFAYSGLWFVFLLILTFQGSRIFGVMAWFLLAGAAAYTAWSTPMDPLAWVSFFSFSVIMLWGVPKFKIWAKAKYALLQDETRTLSKKLKTKQSLLKEKIVQTNAANAKANELFFFYDNIKDMSKSLDKMETFFIFGQALRPHFRFKSIQLAFFNEMPSNSTTPAEVFELRFEDCAQPYDKKFFQKDENKIKTQLPPYQSKIIDIVFSTQRSFYGFDAMASYDEEILNTVILPKHPPFIAHPVVVNKKICAILFVVDVSKGEMPVMTVLTERFLAEFQRIKLYESVETLAITDGLTGVYVRRHLLDRLVGEVERSKRFGYQLTFLMIDIDHFKDFNDRYGHLVGDVVLKQVAETIKKSLREIDVIGRYGGEEFGAILTETDEKGGIYAAERIRRAIAERMFKAYQEDLQVTVSIGCSTLSKDICSTSLVIDSADSALYEAKRQGRNRVCVTHSINDGPM